MKTPSNNNRLWSNGAALALLFILGGGFLALFGPAPGDGMTSAVYAASEQADHVPTAEPQTAGSPFTLIAADHTSMILELTVDEPVIEDLLLQGEPFQRLTLPDSELTMNPGAPQLPLYSTLLGVPTTADLTFAILAAEPETRPGLLLAPAPRSLVRATGEQAMSGGELTEVFTLDTERYQTDAFYPGPLVEVGDSGYMRDQAIARVTFYPVQYNPVRREIQLYRRLRVRIAWAATTQAATATQHGSSAAYEGVLAQLLLNYESLGRSPVTPLPLNAVAQTAPPAAQAAAASATALQVKIGVDHDGIYALDYQQLTQAGFDLTTLDPRTFTMSNRGQPVALLLIGEEDGRFDQGDRILFYGAGIANDRYTTINVYWLTTGSQPGPRMAVSAAVGGALGGAPPFRTTVHAERDTIYWQNMLTANDQEDRWFWERRLSLASVGFPAARTYTVTLASLADMAAPPPTLRVKLKGYTNANHLTQIYINDHAAGPAFAWAGQVEYTHTVEIAAGWLKEGANLVKVEVRPGAVPPGGGAPDEILVNWVEIEYWRTYRAVGDAFPFTTMLTGEQRFDLTGFTDAAITVLDVTNTATPRRMATTPPVSAGPHWGVAFTANATPAQRYFAASLAGYQQPLYLTPDEPSNLRSVMSGTNYLLITHPNFYASAAKLAQYRQDTAKLQTQIVKIDDIYDEFNFGIANPRALRDYLRYAYTSTIPAPPDYVLLLGDATLDYRGNFPIKMPNYVPTQIVTSTLFGEVPSDNWFVALAGADPLPELFIGRLAAQTAAEANTMVDKIITYQPDATWNKTTLFVADDDETKFRTNSVELMQRLPYDYITKTIYVTNTAPVATYRNQLINTINQGVILVNYFGHGETFGWGLTPHVGAAADYIFHKQDIARLTNRNRLPVITIANCLNGAFAGAGDQPSLAEALQSAPDGGAVAVWAPASIGHPTGHRELIGNFYAAIFADDRLELGRAAVAAKAATFRRSSRWAELVESYVLLGDPAMKVAVATTDPYVVNVNPAHGATAVAVNRPIELLFNKPMSATTVALTSVPPVAYRLIEARDNRLFIFAHPPLTHFTTYTLQVQGQDLVGHNGLRPGLVQNPWFFTTAQDLPPAATIMIRAGISLAGRGDAIVIDFSEPVRPTIDYVITPSVAGRLILSPDGRQARFEHENFTFGQTYSFTLRSAEDATGNRLSSTLTFTFTVGALNFLPMITR